MFPGWMRWRKRRRGSGFEFLIAESIGAIHPQYWDRLAEAQRLFSRSTWPCSGAICRKICGSITRS